MAELIPVELPSNWRPSPGKWKQGRQQYYAAPTHSGDAEFVACSKCDFRFGEVFPQDERRAFLFRHGFRPCEKGFWRLTRHAIEQLRRGRKPSDRRYAKPPHLGGRVVERRLQPLSFPVAVHCPECRRINVLDGPRLNLQDYFLDPKRAIIETSPAGDYMATNRVIQDPLIPNMALHESLRRAWARGEQTPANLAGMRRSEGKRRALGKWP